MPSPAPAPLAEQTFVVQYDRTFSDAWHAAHVNSVADHVSDQFFRKNETEFGTKKLVGIKIVFDQEITCGAVAAYMQGHQMRPATFYEQLAYLEAYPTEPIPGPFIIIGTIWEHDTVEEGHTIHLRDFPYITLPNNSRDLELWRCNIPLKKEDVFLGIKEGK